jgi:uncharacterized membrane protein YkoI
MTSFLSISNLNHLIISGSFTTIGTVFKNELGGITMNKKLMVGALAVALIGGGIAGAALLPSTNAATPPTASATAPVQQDTDTEVNDDGVQGAQDTDTEVNDDGAQGAQDTDKEVNDDGAQGAQDTDKEVNDDGAQAQAQAPAPAISKQQSIDIAVKQTPGEVTSVQLESEDGVNAYTVTIKDAAGKEQEITIDATTGIIIPEND